MDQFQDVKHDALLILTGLIEGQTDDLENVYLRGETGEAEGSNNDLWILEFAQAGITRASFNDMAYEWLALQSFTEPTLNERWYNFWSTAVSGVNSYGLDYDASYG